MAYPNPAQDVIHIHIKKNMNKPTNFILYNSLGLMIKQGLIIDNKYDLLINELPNGFYHLMIKNDTLNEIKKYYKKLNPPKRSN